jgi:hypothetical protein
MRYLMTYTGDDTSPPSPEKMAALGAYTQEMIASGVVVDTGGILPPSMGGARVAQTSGKFAVTDGPFPETKELIVGYAIVEVASREEAIEHARKFMSVAGDGTAEIRQLMRPQDEGHH